MKKSSCEALNSTLPIKIRQQRNMVELQQHPVSKHDMARNDGSVSTAQLPVNREVVHTHLPKTTVLAFCNLNQGSGNHKFH